MLQNTQLCGFTGNQNFLGQYFRDDFESYSIGDRVTFLNSNNGFFSGTGWVITASAIGLQAREKFEDYTIGIVESSMLDSGGIGWGAPNWSVEQSYYGLQGIDNFESYSDTENLSLGSGFLGTWEVE